MSKALVFAAFLPIVASAALDYAIVPDHADHLYRCGETATFTVTVTDGEAAPTGGVVTAHLDNFGPREVADRTWDLAVTNVFTIAGALDEPGFLRLTLASSGTPEKNWSVGYEPARIRKGSPSPEDFDAFWAAAREKLAREVPLDPQLTEVPERSTKDFTFYRVSFATFGRRVHGYLSVPTDRSKAPYRVEVEVNAAGFGNWTNDLTGRDDAICLRMSVYPFEMDWRWKALGMKEKLFDAMEAERKAKYDASYASSGIAASREEYFFYPVLLGIDRAVDWVVAREDADRSRVVYQGTSQGGGFGFYLTGLNRAFTKAAFFVPAITDTMGYLKGRRSGWPRIVESNSKTPERKAAAERNAPYFDAANFASRIRCPVRVAVGFSDTTCPPCAVYASYNEVTVADKEIVHGFGMTHSCFRTFYQQLGEWVRR